MESWDLYEQLLARFAPQDPKAEQGNEGYQGKWSRQPASITSVEEAQAFLDGIQAYIATGGVEDNAHELQDYLWTSVLLGIKTGAPRASELAAIALQARDIPFQRYYG
jgi:hypothetical protein